MQNASPEDLIAACLAHEESAWTEMVRRYAHMSVKHLEPYASKLIFPVTIENGGNRKRRWTGQVTKMVTVVTG